MAFPKVPTDSKTKINKAGHVLVQADPQSPEFHSALKLAERWRACHAYPINTFQKTLRDYIKDISSGGLVAQRLKRMPTIMDKLRRYNAMTLTTMQDIAGVRAVVGKVSHVYTLANKYRKKSRLEHELYNYKDYIAEPRNDDGYRSIHIMYKYRNKANPMYDGLRIEIQLRSQLQHIWATAVETMGTFLGQALKSRQGSADWLDFFAVASSAFASLEKSPPVPRFRNFTGAQIFSRLSQAEEKLSALNMMKGLSVAAKEIEKSKGSGEYYHLIVLNSLKKTLQIKGYNRRSFQRAIDDYGKIEERVVKGEKVEPVLVSAGPISKLRKAYPNFFLDISEFTRIVSTVIARSRQRRNSHS